jgi:probable F420-dependent oxidoreductase
MRFGVYLPTYAWPDLTPEHTGRLQRFARRAEALGFDALWAGEHFMVAGHYGVAWMSPLVCLAHAAAVTTRIRLATGVLVLPYHHPLPLAREIQTLHQLSGGRMVLGVGTGWDAEEFDALGMSLAERGARTDEILAALRRLLTETDVTFRGRHYRFEHVTIAPVLPRFPELWVGGGSKLVGPSSPDKPYLAPTVLARIAAADGWLARGDAPVAMVTADLRTIRAYLTSQGRDPASLRYGHYNFAHLVDTDDHDEAVRLQRPRFERTMGSRRPFADLERCYLFGTTAEIAGRIADLEAAGFQDFVLMTLDYDLDQLERFASGVMARFRAPAAAAILGSRAPGGGAPAPRRPEARKPRPGPRGEGENR